MVKRCYKALEQYKEQELYFRANGSLDAYTAKEVFDHDMRIANRHGVRGFSRDGNRKFGLRANIYFKYEVFHLTILQESGQWL